MGMNEQKQSKKIRSREQYVPRELNYKYIYKVFQYQYHSINQSRRDSLCNGNSLQTMRFLLNEYTRSRLIHYDRLNAHLLGISSISDIVVDAKHTGSLVNFLMKHYRDQVEKFGKRMDDLFSPVVAQSALFLINKLLKNPFNRTTPSHGHFPPIRELLHEFIRKIDPQRKENFHWYYHPSNLRTINIFLEKNPHLDITQIFPLFFENDEFYVHYTDWVESLQDGLHIYDARQEMKDEYDRKKESTKILEAFLNVYSGEAKIPADIDKQITNFLPKILHLDLIREICSFYENFLPDCFPEDSKIKLKVLRGIAMFKTILDHTFGQNFVSMGHYEFNNLLKTASIPDKFVESWMLDLDKPKSRINGYNRLWKTPFFRFQKTGKNPKTIICFSYVQVLDAFFYFLSSLMKSYIMASTRGRGFEELIAQRIINELGIVPYKIIIHDPEKTRDDQDFQKLLSQNNLTTPDGVRIHNNIIAKSREDLDVDRQFRWREIDLAFVYKHTLYIIECKNHLFCKFADFEPVVLKRNITTLNLSYEKRKLLLNPGVKKSLTMLGGKRYDDVRFMIVTGEECPFDFMLSYKQFDDFLRNFASLHQQLEEHEKKYVSKTAYFNKEFVFFSEEDVEDLAEEKLNQSTENTITIDLEFDEEVKRFNKLMKKY